MTIISSSSKAPQFYPSIDEAIAQNADRIVYGNFDTQTPDILTLSEQKLIRLKIIEANLTSNIPLIRSLGNSQVILITPPTLLQALITIATYRLSTTKIVDMTKYIISVVLCLSFNILVSRALIHNTFEFRSVLTQEGQHLRNLLGKLELPFPRVKGEVSLFDIPHLFLYFVTLAKFLPDLSVLIMYVVKPLLVNFLNLLQYLLRPLLSTCWQAIEKSSAPPYYQVSQLIDSIPSSMTGIQLDSLANSTNDQGLFEDLITQDAISEEALQSARILVIGPYALNIKSALTSMLTRNSCVRDQIPHPVENRSLFRRRREEIFNRSGCFFFYFKS